LRDDVKKLLEELLSLHTHKLGLINRLLLNEADLRHHIDSENPENIHKIIEQDNDIIAGVDLTDFTISETTRVLCGILGITPDRFDSFLMETSRGIHAELAGIMENTFSAISTLREERGRSVEQMKEVSRSTGRKIEEIESMFRIDIKT